MSNRTGDGHMQMEQPEGRVSYEPNSLSKHSPREDPVKGFHRAQINETGEKGRVRPESFATIARHGSFTSAKPSMNRCP